MTKTFSPTNFHLWFPNIFEFKGGIQVYSAFLLKALQNIYPNASYQIFLKHDTKQTAGFAFLPQTEFYFAGAFPLKIRTLVYGVQLFIYGTLKRPDLIITTHVHFAIVADLLKRFWGIPYWIVAHGVEVWDIQKPSLKRALRNADRILAVSGYTRDRLLQSQSLHPDRLVILPNTFDSQRFQIAPKPPHLLQHYQLQPQQPIILTVARLDSTQPYKGYDKIIEALPQIRAVFPDVHYLIVGKGDDRPRLKTFIHKQQLEHCVTLVGFVPDEELGDYYNLCDVFAMPSKGEGFGIVYLEALGCGKPVVGGNQDGAIDALCHGTLGVLVNPDNLQEIATNIIKIIQKNHPNSILQQPEKLRKEVMNIYGFAQFQETLAKLLLTFVFGKDKIDRNSR